MSNFIEKNQYVWVERYRPKSIDDVILPKSVKKTLKGIIKKGDLTNLLFYGSAGCGKTSSAKAICEQLGFDYMFINGTNCGVDTARYTFPQFASSLSLENDKRKVIIIDEAEKMSESFSQAFNSFIEEYSDNCAFILTTNFPNRLLPSLRSRFNDVSFDVQTLDEKRQLFIDFITIVFGILDKEGITYDKKVVSNYIADYFPDMRKCLNMLQANSLDGEINNGVLSRKEYEFDVLFKHLKAKHFIKMMEFVQENELEFHKTSEAFTKNIEKIDKKSIPVLFKLISDYDYRNSLATNKQANLIAFLTDIMTEVIFV
jgi:replication factor C small subunit